MTFFTLVGFLFLVSLAILDSYPNYRLENVGKNISKKRYFLHVKKIKQFCIRKQLKHHHSWTGYFNTLQANFIFQYSLKISENWSISIAEIDPKIA